MTRCSEALSSSAACALSASVGCPSGRARLRGGGAISSSRVLPRSSSAPDHIRVQSTCRFLLPCQEGVTCIVQFVVGACAFLFQVLCALVHGLHLQDLIQQRVDACPDQLVAGRFCTHMHTGHVQCEEINRYKLHLCPASSWTPHYEHLTLFANEGDVEPNSNKMLDFHIVRAKRLPQGDLLVGVLVTEGMRIMLLRGCTSGGRASACSVFASKLGQRMRCACVVQGFCRPPGP